MSTEVHFGGPDQPAGALRDLLAARVAAVPAGGSIDWVTYYFRDRRLARDLLTARHRGVRVRVTLEGRPRTPHANDRVVRLLSGPEADRGEAPALRTVVHRGPIPGRRSWRPHLHEKLYCFSHPEPTALLGSFNPSGDDPEDDPAVIEVIGDHDRGHNTLVEVREPPLVEALTRHARLVHASGHGPLERFSRAANRELRGRDLAVHFWPRARRHPVARLLTGVGRGARVRVAASHIKGPGSERTFVGLARRGAAVEILCDASPRRVPVHTERALTAADVPIRRVGAREGLPMHDKFVLIEEGGRRTVAFGSFNWTSRSLYLSHEIGAVSSADALCERFAERWDSLAARAC